MITKKEAAKALSAKGILLPDNWSKMTTDRALVWATNEIAAYADTGDEALKLPLPELDGLTGEEVKDAKAFLGKPKTKRGVMAVVGAALATAGAAVMDTGRDVLSKATGGIVEGAASRNAKVKNYSDPTYHRSTRAMRREAKLRFGDVGHATLPEVPTRQMLRRDRLDQNKQPLSMTQVAWHRIKGYGKVQPFGSSIRQTRNKAEKLRRQQAIRDVAMGVAR